MDRNPVVWFEIYVNDLKQAQKFYEGVLGHKLEPLASPVPGIEMLAFPMHMNGLGAAGVLAKMENGPSPGAGTIVYFGTEDCAQAAGRVTANGGKLVKDKFSIGQYGFIALASDPDGNMIGFHSMR